jgi:uracil-DNA glycosylase
MRIEPSPRVPAYFPSPTGRIAVVAQSPGREEVRQGKPLVGPSGQLLEDCFRLAGLDFNSVLRTNLIGFQPPGDNFDFFCGNKKEAGKDYPFPAIGPGRYLLPVWFDEIARLREELARFSPNLVVCCGNEALWALCNCTGITKYSGAVRESTLVPGLKVLPVFHPAAALREYSLKPQIAQALVKAAYESEFPDIKYTNREIWIYPEIEDLWSWHEQEKNRGSLLSVDIESPHGHIDCIGLSFRPVSSLVVPFWSDLRDGHNYWRTAGAEALAWDFIEFLLLTYPILGQNFICFDSWKLLFDIGIFPKRILHDTMTAHHAYQPELPKSLGFLTATYCSDTAYKTLRPRGMKEEKREE